MATKILVTGGAGYIGSVLVPELLDTGAQVTVIDNFMYKQNSLAAVCHNDRFKVINADVRVEPLMKSALATHDIIIPLAAYVGAPLCAKDPLGATSTNKDAIRMMLKNISTDQRILMPTTNSGYGVGEEGIYCTEDTPLRPISQYAREKVEIEKEILSSHGNSISFRLATVFGCSPKMRIDLLVNDFVYRAVYDKSVIVFEGHFKRNYIHVRDVAKAFLHGIQNFDRMKNEPYNVGLSDANISKIELCQKIKVHLPEFIFIDAPIGEDPDKRDYIVSNEKIENTGYKQDYSLDKGIDELIKGYAMIKNTLYSNI